MATTFAYKVKDKSGQVTSGTLEGDSVTTIVTKLRQKGLTVLNVSAKSSSQSMNINIGPKKKVKIKEITVFSRQFATMINSGLSLTKALHILAEQTENSTFKEVISQVQKDVEAGQTLSEALAKHPRVFSNLFINMVKAGETGGVLDDVLLRVADHYEKDIAIKSKIKSAMTYPIAMFIMSMLIVFAMITFVVPVFIKMFAQLGGDLPLPTKMLVFSSDAIHHFWYILIAFAVGARFALRAYKNSNSGRLQLDKIKLKLPVFGQLFTKLAIARFTRTFGTLISSGVPILQAMDIVADTANNQVISGTIKNARSSIKEGETIAQPLEKSPVFPPMVVQMIAVGEETGALDSMLVKIADFYDEEVGNLVESLTSLIEPLMIVFMGIVVGGIIISLYLPMFSMINLIK